MNKILSTIIGFIFFGSIASAQLTEFSQGDILSAGAMNQNFKHLQDQFSWTKKEIDCSTDNLTKTINDGYNHIVINGNCSVGALLIGKADISIYCSAIQDHDLINYLKIEGKTGMSNDKITIGNTGSCGNLFGTIGGELYVQNVTIDSSAVMSNDGGNMRIANSNITSDSSDPYMNSSNNGLLRLENVTSVHSVSADDGSVLILDNLTTTKKLSINNGASASIGSSSSMPNIEMNANSSLKLENSTVDCSSTSDICITVGYLSVADIKNSTINGSSAKEAMRILVNSAVSMEGSTINSSASNAVVLEQVTSFLYSGDSTINGNVSCSQNSKATNIDGNICAE